MHFEVPNPKIDFSKMLVTRRLIDWPNGFDGPRRAAVSTFGAGGTNGHVVLERYSIAGKSKELTSRPFL